MTEGTTPTPRDQQPPPPRGAGGVVHTYQQFDPGTFPSPTAPPPDLTSTAFEHMLAFGSLRHLSEEDLANAVRIDPSMFPKLGPSLESLIAMLEEWKRKILSTYETEAARERAGKAYQDRASGAQPPKELTQEFARARRDEQVRDFERLWYKHGRDQSEFSRDLLKIMQALGEKYQVEQLASKYAFTGRQELTVPEALAVKEELETIDKLLKQLREAMKDAKIGVIDMDELSEFADPGEIEALNRLQEQIEDYIREQARAQGLEFTKEGYKLTPNAYRVFQRRLLQEIFADLQAARSGRHTGPVIGEGAVELEKTKAYEFGDSAAHVDMVQTIVNAAARGSSRPGMDDITIQRTRNNPKCATMVLMDMSGSMRYGGQYINCKRMALALDGLIRAEYPGDFLGFVEMFSFAKLRTAADVATLLPKPVSIHAPRVRLKADMSRPEISESQVPQHFTNIQHALSLARTVLQGQDTPNRQVILITDGLPTAHFEGKDLYLLYPPDPLTESATMREAMLCRQQSITINIFLLPSWSQSSEDVQFAHRMAETTRGRVFFTGGTDLDRFVLWDYVANRRKIIGR